MTLRSALALATVTLCSACTTAAPRPPAASESRADAAVRPAPAQNTQDAPPDIANARRPEATRPFSFREFEVEAFWLPAVWAKLDFDDDQAPTSSADLDTGSGFAGRIAMGTGQESIGILYTQSMQDEETTRTDVRSQQACLDCLYRSPLADLGGAVWLQAAGGFGLAWVDFDDDRFDSYVTGAAELRFALEFHVTRQFALTGGIMGFLWGEPGDTKAYGTAATLGASLVF